jgi:SAM-dependent methyltransferase
MSGQTPFPYDAVFYPGAAFEQTHPDRLATIATLRGMSPAPPSRCRMLELGCGVGANLLPMAYRWPDSEFVGIDLSAPTIAQGCKTVADVGLTNIVLRACDIMQVDESFGEFDYIIAQGVYSWVPNPVGEKILSIFRERLAPHGVAYVSFNAYPGSHIRDLGRDMMLFRVRGMREPTEKVEAARSLVRWLDETSDRQDLYRAVLRVVHDRVRGKADPVLYHDDRSAEASAFLFADVAEAASRERLQYLGEADFSFSTFGAPPAHARSLLERIPAEQVVAREQYLDFLTGRWFRESLFCHEDVALAMQSTRRSFASSTFPQNCIRPPPSRS